MFRLFYGLFDKVILLPVLVVQMLSELIKRSKKLIDASKSKYKRSLSCWVQWELTNRKKQLNCKSFKKQNTMLMNIWKLVA
jgi:hypothetical protein